jgi:T4 RnlA family RNA ligase
MGFDNNEALLAQQLLDCDADIKFFCLDMYENGWMPLFELVGNDNKIVVDYSKNELKLIAVRDYDGNFIPLDGINYKNKVQLFDKSLDDIIEECKTATDMEGYVIRFTDQTLIKVKSLWYIERHRLTSNADRLKEVFKYILNDTLDDILAIASNEKKNELIQIQHKVVKYVGNTSKEIKEILDIVKHKDRKSIASMYKSHEYFNIIMSCVKKMICDIQMIEGMVKEQMLKRYNAESKVKIFLEGLNDE